jgi:hypothetical protein
MLDRAWLSTPEVWIKGPAAALRATRTALAVERYRADHSELPGSLDALVPGYLPSVPLDPWVEQPMRYRAYDDSYVVYSVGRNFVDDGGMTSKRKWPNNTTPELQWWWERLDVAFMVERGVAKPQTTVTEDVANEH